MSENILINGDNLKCLKFLSKDYLGKIDIIYIDPPYNTGSTNFKYKDKMTHKEWSDFMKPRLSIACDLLSEDGVIFISIDDNELYNLKLLCDEILGEKNFISNIIWRKTGQQQNNGKNISNIHEYILCYAKKLYDKNNKKKQIFIKDNIKDRKGIKAYSHYDKEKDNYFRLNPIQDKTLGKYEYDLIHPVSKKIVNSKYWRISKKDYEELYGKGMIYWTSNLPNVKKYLDIEEGVLPFNYIDNIYNESGNNDLKKIIGINKFTNPKPVALIKKLIKYHKNKNAIILDFFAGSGTTGQAVMELNKDDKGNRHFILCTNNENNICEEVTYQRLHKLVQTEYKQNSFDYIILENFVKEEKDYASSKS